MFQQKVSEKFAKQPLTTENLLSKDDTAHLPVCVQKHLEYTVAIDKSKLQNVCLEFDTEMYRNQGEKPMKSQSVQHNFYGDYSRLFLMKASKMGIPFKALHLYINEQAIFRVKVTELFKVVDL